MIQDIRVTKIVSVFGNPIEPMDSLVVSLVPELEKQLPEIDFQVVDPTEILEPPSDPWIILDVGLGIDGVVIVEDLSDLDHIKGQSVHDYDVYMELRLKEKLGELPKVKIVIVPVGYEKKRAVEELVKIFSTLL